MNDISPRQTAAILSSIASGDEPGLPDAAPLRQACCLAVQALLEPRQNKVNCPIGKPRGLR